MHFWTPSTHNKNHFGFKQLILNNSHENQGLYLGLKKKVKKNAKKCIQLIFRNAHSTHKKHRFGFTNMFLNQAMP